MLLKILPASFKIILQNAIYLMQDFGFCLFPFTLKNGR